MYSHNFRLKRAAAALTLLLVLVVFTDTYAAPQARQAARKIVPRPPKPTPPINVTIQRTREGLYEYKTGTVKKTFTNQFDLNRSLESFAADKRFSPLKLSFKGFESDEQRGLLDSYMSSVKQHSKQRLAQLEKRYHLDNAEFGDVTVSKRDSSWLVVTVPIFAPSKEDGELRFVFWIRVLLRATVDQIQSIKTRFTQFMERIPAASLQAPEDFKEELRREFARFAPSDEPEWMQFRDEANDVVYSDLTIGVRRASDA